MFYKITQYMIVYCGRFCQNIPGKLYVISYLEVIVDTSVIVHDEWGATKGLIVYISLSTLCYN